ncbi:MAG: anthranilate synthase component I family protein [Bacteroidales bacterium]|nr:anthranilate synthase component I family protein [Bacteroidales bacterium]
MNYIETKITSDNINVCEKLLEYSQYFDISCILNSNSQFYPVSHFFLNTKYDLIAGFSTGTDDNYSLVNYSDLDSLNDNKHRWYLGYLTYDIKNHIENLTSGNMDNHNWPEIFFFQPEILFLVKQNRLTVLERCPEKRLLDKYQNINPCKENPTEFDLQLTHRLKKKEYCENVCQLQKHIQRGDIYEVNYCHEFYAKHKINPYSSYLVLNNRSPAPFSAFLKLREHYLLSASPERFLKKEKNILYSQPIKGTAPRGFNIETDEEIRKQLSESIKEQSENTMIVDLVRNDLSKIAKRNSVKVNELHGIYAFPQVHQMISTISATLNTNSFKEIIKATFPMGSMTGAPKVQAMKHIEDFENVKRGLYSGSVGYISPEGDFDLNVVIRSLQYNAHSHYISYMTGSAITALSSAENEYEECLMKVYGISNSLQSVRYA